MSTIEVAGASLPAIEAERGAVKIKTRLRGVALVAVLALLALLIVKIEFRNPSSNYAFWVYGILVTTVVFSTMTVAFGFYRDPALMVRARRPELFTAAGRAAWPLVSCVVAVHNEEELVGRCVASMLAQTYPRTEIIVIDDASTDQTREVLRKLGKEYTITVVELDKNRGKKGALAAGLLQARGSIIAFADSDTVWEPDAVEMAVPVFLGAPEVGAVSGHCRALNGDLNMLTKIQDSWYEGQYSVRKAFESFFGAVTCVSGPLAFFRLAAIYNFMPAWEQDRFLGQEFRFATDRTLTAFVLGGTYLGRKLLPPAADSPYADPVYPLRDWKIVYSKSARAWTSVPSTVKSMIKQQVRWKKSFIRNIFVTGRFYWRRPLLPALFYYVHVMFVVLGPFVAARHLIYMPLRGDPISPVLYLTGILIIGLSFGLAYRHENPGSRRWIYRPAMSLISTLIFSWLIFYSAATVRKMTWHRGLSARTAHRARGSGRASAACSAGSLSCCCFAASSSPRCLPTWIPRCSARTR
jgi:cellulose synthase/poly-beta-1,6-N-acetylglucosamine synthase-like glycosyltransferase